MKVLDMSAGGDLLTARVIRFVRENGLDRPGFHHIAVAHDDWCEFLNGRGVCNCDPNLELSKPRGAA